MPAIDVEPLSGGGAVPLGSLTRPGVISALVIYKPNEQSRDAVSLLRWFQSEGVPLTPILLDAGRDSAVSADFARRFAGTLKVYRPKGDPDWEKCGITDPTMQLPIVHFIRDAPSAHAKARRPFEADAFLQILAQPDMMGVEALRWKLRLQQQADQPGAALLSLYFKLWDEGSGAQAQFIADRISQVRSQDPLAMLVWANARLARHRNEVEAYMKGVDERSMKGAAKGMMHYVLAKLAYLRRDYSTAVNHFTAAISAGMGDQHNRTLYQLAQALRYGKRVPEAIAAYRKAISLGFENVDCYHFLGETIDNEADKIPALETYDRAIQLAPWAGELYRHRGQMLHAMDRHEEAASAWLKGTEVEDDYSRNFEEAGNCLLWHLKRGEEAYTVLREGIRLRGNGVRDRGAANLWNNFGVAAFQRKERELAVACYLEAIRIQKNQSYAYGNLGEAYESLGRPGNAIWAYETGIKEAPRSPRMSAMKLGLARAKKGEPLPNGTRASDSTSGSDSARGEVSPSDGPPVREAD